MTSVIYSLKEVRFLSWRPAIFSMDFLQTFRLRQLFAGTQTATVAEWAFKDALEQRNPEWSEMEYSWRDVRASLHDDDLAVEIIRTGPSYQDYTAVLLRKGWNAPKSVFLCTQEQLDSDYNVNKQVEYYTKLYCNAQQIEN